MKSSGVYGASSSSALMARNAARLDTSCAQPLAEGAVADLVVVLDAVDEALRRQARSDGVPRARPQVLRELALVEPALRAASRARSRDACR